VETLVRDALDLGRMGVRGMEAIAGLACAAPAVELQMGAPVDASRAVRRHLEWCQGRTARTTVHHPPRDASDGAAGLVKPGADVHTWEFSDGSAVLFDPVAGRLATLESAGFALWRSIIGIEPRADSASLTPSLEPAGYLAHLAAAGFITAFDAAGSNRPSGTTG
jgi:hypothetical protein